MRESFNLIFMLLSISIYSQTGSAGSPFVALGQARNVITPGIYYFNLGEITFSSYVNANGMVLVATDYGGAPAANLPQVTALTNTGRGILSPTVLATLTSATVASYTTSSGAINVTSSDANILNRIVSNSTIHTGVSDVTINANWTGTGQTIVRGSASDCASSHGGNQLQANIHHPCGDLGDLHWIPLMGGHREIYENGENPGVQFNLWVQAPLVALPVRLSDFKGKIANNNSIQLNWTTLSETNSDYFILERSLDRQNWLIVAKLAAGNHSNLSKHYTAVDENPGDGKNFYRLKIVDLDGTTEYSKIVDIFFSGNSYSSATVFPNPVKNRVYVTGNDLGEMRIYDGTGIDITKRIGILRINKNQSSLDFSFTPNGMYIIKGDRFSKKIIVNR